MLSLEKCENIWLSEDCSSNIKSLGLSETELNPYIDDYYTKEVNETPENKEIIFHKIKLPKLEKCDFCCYYEKYYSIIDLKSLICLKYFNGEKNDFLQLESESLIDINLLSNFNSCLYRPFF